MEEFLLNLIGNYAFPVVMCIYMCKRMNDESNSHREEVDKLSTAIENNTLVITKLAERMDVKE